MKLLRDEWNFCSDPIAIFNIILPEKFNKSAFFSYYNQNSEIIEKEGTYSASDDKKISTGE